MFQFPRLAFVSYVFRNKYLLLISASPNPGREFQNSELQISKVGFPIRKFTDQSLFAAPHDLSQRTTSFIASQRQGIHQIPLRHLIALIAKARILVRSIDSARLNKRAPWLEKTSFASSASGDLSGQAPNPRLVARRAR